MNYELKTDPATFDAVAQGLKTFEIRYDDRGYNVGDKLTLRRTKHTGQEMKDGKPLVYSGAVLEVRVSHIMRGPVYGLADKWVIMSIEKA